ncbi:actin-3-like [Acipenser oxyrinchus oxyrinchus]|uniref:Actin-3-like n=1 Tax=Acipenser oxyrinchus oxyrinchus TaxID=40147 RepID=A0AAD8LUS6_ACIOX|nr:actin-3-like [Acipenser oxyrinchus oxyrinchus]
MQGPIALTKGHAKVAKLVKNDPKSAYPPKSLGPDATASKPGTAGGAKPGTVGEAKPAGGLAAKVDPPTIVKHTKAVILDLGTGYLKAGFGGQPKPSCVISSTVGKPRQQSAKTGDNRQMAFVGKELLDRPDLDFVNPLKHGIVTDWDLVESLWNYVFKKELKIPSEEHAVMVSDPPLSPTTNREKFAEIMFENFSIPAMYIAYQSILSLYSYGRTTGIVVESGHGVSYAVPIHDGYHLPNCTGRVDYAGDDLNKYLIKLLKEGKQTFTDSSLNIVDDIKRKCCYIPLDIKSEMSLTPNDYTVDYELPDGHLITVGKERFRCPEALFRPNLLGSQEPGLHALTMNSINKCDINLKKDLLKNILVCGGSTLFKGFPDRLQNELVKIAPNSNPIVVATPERKYSVWIGGSIMASLKSFQQLWVQKKDYDERGPFVIYRKCY